MKKRIALILLIWGSIFTANANVKISQQSNFYLITCGPGTEVYSLYGHSGILVQDPVNQINDIFHWGIFSFDTPNFIGRFIEGETYYRLGVAPLDYFVANYDSLTAHQLILTYPQKERLWNLLCENYRPENREFLYNFVYDNCATRPYNIIAKTYDTFTNNTDYQATTYRNIIEYYNDPASWLYLGITMIIGSEADKTIDVNRVTGFPFYMKDVLLNCTTIDSLGNSIPVLSPKEIVIKSTGELRPNNPIGVTYYLQILLPLLIAIGLILYYALRKKHHYLPIISEILLILSSLIGLIITYLWFFSMHPLVANNFNILWLMPLNLILAIILFTKVSAKVKGYCVLVSAILCYSFVFVLIFGLQRVTAPLFGWWILIATNLTLILLTYKNELKRK